MDDVKSRVGLSLSGGGYRASAFHLGTLNKLNELKVLPRIDVLSTISGGSITGAAWCLHQGDYPSFHEEMVRKIKTKNVIKYILSSATFCFAVLFILVFLAAAAYLSFTRWSPWTLPVIVLMFFLFMKFQFKIFPVSKVIERAYNKFFYDGKTLGQLNDRPILAIGSSNLQTGRPFTFSKIKMADSTYTSKADYDPTIHFKHKQFPIARAVMASSCVPFAFTPISISKEYFENEADCKRCCPVLIDGGVYDNQGIQKITQPKSSYECGTIITSDAGGNFRATLKYPNAIALLIRTVDLFMYRIKTAQMTQNIYRNVDGAEKPIAYLSLGWRIQNLVPGFISNLIAGQIIKEVLDAHQLKPEWLEKPKEHIAAITIYLKERIGYDAVEKRDLTTAEWNIARSTGTSLSCLSDKQMEYLIRHAENLTELQVKLYCPNLITTYGT